MQRKMEVKKLLLQIRLRYYRSASQCLLKNQEENYFCTTFLNNEMAL